MRSTQDRLILYGCCTSLNLPQPRKDLNMDIVYNRCCGLDVHKKSITACAITPKGKEIETFGTMTYDLFQLVNWIKSKNCTHVAMESIGVYWIPIYNLLDLEEIQPMVVNAAHIKAVPGRKIV